MRGFGGPSSPSARALQEHEPGMSLPGGLASALSRIHMQGSGRVGSGLVNGGGREEGGNDVSTGQVPMPGNGNGLGNGLGSGRREEHDDEGIFSMDG